MTSPKTNPPASLRSQEIALSAEQRKLLMVSRPVVIPGYTPSEFDVLEIALVLENKEFDGRRYLLGQPAVSVNHQLFGGERMPVVDTLDLLATGELACSHAFNLFTCSCGVSECAGYMDPVELFWGESHVTWAIPVRGYSQHLPTKEAPGPWQFVFERSQYLNTLARLKEELFLLEQAHPGQLRYSPVDLEAETHLPYRFRPMSEVLQRLVEHRRQRLASAPLKV